MRFGDRLILGVQDLYGTPFVLYGSHSLRDGGLSCVGFVIEAFRRQGVDLGDPDVVKTSAQILARCQRTPTAERGDLIVFQVATHPRRRQALHLGLVLSPTWFLGCQPKGGVSEVEWSSDPDWRDRLSGFARVVRA